VALVAGLRWKLLRNALRTEKGKLDLAARVLIAFFAGIGAVGVGLSLGVAAYAGLTRGRSEPLTIALWVVFVCWQLFPVLLAGFLAEFDFENLLRFPLHFSSFVALSLAYGLLDPPSLVAFFWALCVAGGALAARPDLFPTILAALLLFTAVNLFLNRVFLSWLQKLMAKRRTREALVAVVLLVLLGVQLFGALAERWEGVLKPMVKWVAPLVGMLPPGATAQALQEARRGNTPGVAVAGMVLVVYALVFGLLLRLRLRAQYFGEDVGEEAPQTSPRDTTVRAGWRLPGFRGGIAALVEKELRYAMRNGQTWMSAAVPLFLVVFFSLAWQVPKQRPGFLSRAPEMFFPAAVVYSLLVLATLLHNTFAFEGHGLHLLLVAPVRLRQVLLAKNIVHALLILGVSGMILVLVSLLVAPPGLGIVAATFSALAFLALAQFMVGNALSIYFPRQIEFGRLRKRASELNVLLGFLSHIVLLGIVAAILFQTRGVGSALHPWLFSAILLALAVVAGWFYRMSLDWGEQAILKRREALTAEICR